MARTLKAPAREEPMETNPSEPCRIQTWLREGNTVANPSCAPKHEIHSNSENCGPNTKLMTEADKLIQMADDVDDVLIDSESDSDRDAAKKRPRVSEKRKAQDLAFASWSVIYRLSRS